MHSQICYDLYKMKMEIWKSTISFKIGYLILQQIIYYPQTKYLYVFQISTKNREIKQISNNMKINKSQLRNYKSGMGLIICYSLFFICVNSQSTEESSQCTLKITWSQDKPEYKDLEIPLYTAAYSTSIDNLKEKYFDIFLSNPIDGCLKHAQADPISDQKPFLLTVNGDQGECGFHKRIRMAKQIGAKGIIIVNSANQSNQRPYGKYTDSTFFVFFTNDSNAKNALLNSNVLMGKISSNSQSMQKKHAQLWMSSLNKQSYELLQIFNQTLVTIPSIANAITWKPRHALWGCSANSQQIQMCIDNSEYMASCACSGQFCSPEQYSISSDTIVKQDIRQKIIYDDYNDKFFDYTSQFQKKCLNKFKELRSVENCAQSVMNELQMQESAIQYKVDTFLGACNDKTFEELLLDRNRYTQLGYYPAFMIERQPIEYKNMRDFQIQLCRQLRIQYTEGCAKVIQTDNVIYVTVHILLYGCITVGILALVIVLVRRYKKSLSKSMHKEVKMQVEASVANYFALTETK